MDDLTVSLAISDSRGRRLYEERYEGIETISGTLLNFPGVEINGQLLSVTVGFSGGSRTTLRELAERLVDQQMGRLGRTYKGVPKSYVRMYASAVGLSADDVLAEIETVETERGLYALYGGTL